jgi:hypothetical protein
VDRYRSECSRLCKKKSTIENIDELKFLKCNDKIFKCRPQSEYHIALLVIWRKSKEILTYKRREGRRYAHLVLNIYVAFLLWRVYICMFCVVWGSHGEFYEDESFLGCREL